MNITELLDKKVGDLTILEFQDLLDAIDEDDGSMGNRLNVNLEAVDLANRLCDLSGRTLVAIMRNSVPRGLPKG
jgi:hypothetical protein